MITTTIHLKAKKYAFSKIRNLCKTYNKLVVVMTKKRNAIFGICHV